MLKFQSEVAQLLYTHIDLILFDKRQYERRTKELFDELGIRGIAYKTLRTETKISPSTSRIERSQTDFRMGERSKDRTNGG